MLEIVIFGIVLIFWVLLTPCLVIIFFSMMWLGLSILFAFLGGWSTLAQHYQQPAGVGGVTLWTWQSATFGLVSYRWMLKIGANEQGLYLAQPLVFEFAHQPLFIPWEDIIGVEKYAPFFSGVLDLNPVIELRFVKAPNHPCYFQRSLADKIVQASSGRWQYQQMPRSG